MIIERFHRARRDAPRLWRGGRRSARTSSGESDHRDLLEEDRVEDLARDRRGGVATVPATLDEDDDHHLRRLRGGEGGEPGVVLSLLRLRVRDRLRGAGLAGDVETRDTRLSAGPAIVHDGPEAIADHRPHHGREVDVAVHVSRISEHDALLRPLDALYDTRLPQDAAVRDRAHHARDLHWRHEHRALADRHVQGVPARPRARLLVLARLRLGDETDPLGAELDPGGRAESERFRVLRDGRAADLQSLRVEIHVARLRDAAAEVDGAMTFLLPVLPRAVPEVELARAVHLVHRRDRAFLKARGHQHDLEHRSWRILRLAGAVEQRMVGILHEPQPRGAIDVAGELVDLEGRRRHEREHVAVARVHHHHGARLALHRFLGELLDAAVDRGDDLGAGMRIGLLDEADWPPQRVDFDALSPIPAAEEFVEEALETGLADELAAAVASLFHLLIVRLAHIAEQVGGEAAGRIRAPQLHPDDHAGQLDFP